MPAAASPAAASPVQARRLRTAAGLACGVALVAAMLALTHPSDVAQALGRARWAFVGAAAGSYAAFFLLRGLRWRLLLGPGGAGAGTAALATAAGWLVSTFVP